VKSAAQIQIKFYLLGKRSGNHCALTIMPYVSDKSLMTLMCNKPAELKKPLATGAEDRRAL
jgi:hypothetical protein